MTAMCSRFITCFRRLPSIAGGGWRNYHQFVAPKKMSRVWPMLLAGVYLFVAEGMAATNNPALAARVWRLDDGLPDNSVTGVAQTADGYLWLAGESRQEPGDAFAADVCPCCIWM